MWTAMECPVHSMGHSVICFNYISQRVRRAIQHWQWRQINCLCVILVNVCCLFVVVTGRWSSSMCDNVRQCSTDDLLSNCCQTAVVQSDSVEFNASIVYVCRAAWIYCAVVLVNGLLCLCRCMWSSSVWVLPPVAVNPIWFSGIQCFNSVHPPRCCLIVFVSRDSLCSLV